MQGGLFIALYDEDTLKLYLKNGIYGFLMKPVFSDAPSSRSKHYQALADYACSRQGTDVFFFLNRKIIYGGKITGNTDTGSFYLNGDTSPIGRMGTATLFWNETPRYSATGRSGVFKVEENEKAQPFILKFEQTDNTGKWIISDDLYFELGKYPYPLPSNSMQGMGFCTLTPGEVSILNDLIQISNERIDYSNCNSISINGQSTLFNDSLVSITDDFVNEAQLEFTILSKLQTLQQFKQLWPREYIMCRQVPISPFKPMDMDRADICLYDKNCLIKDGTVPNIVIELKLGRSNFHAYRQATRYLRWLERISTYEEFSKVQAFVIANSFAKIRRNMVDTRYEDKIKILSLDTFDFEELV